MLNTLAHQDLRYRCNPMEIIQNTNNQCDLKKLTKFWLEKLITNRTEALLLRSYVLVHSLSKLLSSRLGLAVINILFCMLYKD